MYSVLKKQKNSIPKLFGSSNNLNIFLMDITESMLNYINDESLDFESLFKSACNKNPLFSCFQDNPRVNDLDEKTKQIFLLTQGFQSSLILLSEYVGCECHNKPIGEYKKEVMDALKQYLNQLVILWNMSDFKKLLATSVLEFQENYSEILQKLSNKNWGLEQAEEDLVCWKDAISDDILQNGLVSLRFVYLVEKFAISKDQRLFDVA